MKTTSKITLFLSLCILGCSLSSCQAASFLLEYPLEKILDCIFFEECPQPRNLEPRSHIIHRPPAEQAVRDYYGNINNNNYQTAWNYLSPQLRQNRKFHPQGYTSYTNWWNKVRRVDVLGIYRVSANPYYSTVDTRLQYLMSSNREIEQTLRFFFVWDSNTNCWLINHVERL
ncbi:MAG: hypothetical protein F6K22_14725 [Okeania sp. SIO2F4]|uniref:hypothetical protein n=1 Tax=Okeania sp. SIO2F4 TaxID=2607790 RepID=UPI00142C777A|nr:hypothetical protein [Okeania sp. SIO2F4]NES03977.1 hypothetical protein [Okeania sp. SIO2F4]